MSNNQKDIIRDNYLVSSGGGEGVLVGGPEWFQWLETHTKFRVEGQGCKYSARKEKRRNGHYWYAYKRSGGKLHKLYIGRSQEITSEHLQSMSHKLVNLCLDEQDPLNLLNNQEQRIFFLNKKITHPVLPIDMISRGSLIQKMNAQIVIVNAPAGYGKTTLVSEWFQSNNKLTAWVTLDKNDNSLIHFWTLINTAFLQAGLKTYLPIVAVHDCLEVFVATIVEEIVFAVQNTSNISKIALILDDYHKITSEVVRQSIQLFLEKLPVCVQVIFSGRRSNIIQFEKISPKITRFEVRGADLLVNTTDSIRYLERQINNPAFSQGKISQLAKDVGGWITGLTLVALILRIDSHINFPLSLSEHGTMQEYLLKNILAQQPPEIKEFLIKTSFLGELNADLCARVTGNPHSAQILERIWAHQLFISKLDSEHNIYQYQSFFSKVLQAQLFAQYPEDASQLLNTAANWNRQNGYLREAVSQYLADQQWDHAITLIEEESLDILKNQGEDSLLLRWIMLLPNASLKNRVELFLFYALLVKLSLAPEYVNANLKSISENIASWDIESQEKKLICAFIGELEDSIEIDASFAKWDKSAWHPEYSETIQLLAAYYNYLFITFDPHKIPEILHQARIQNNKFIYILMSSNHANNLFQLKRFSQGEKYLKALLDSLYLPDGNYPAPTAILYSTLAQINFERNQLVAAQSAIRRNQEIDQNPASTNNLVYRNLLASKFFIAIGDFEKGQIAIDKASRHFFHRTPTLVSRASIQAQQATLHLHKGEIELAEQCVLEIADEDVNFDLTVVKAWILFAKDEFSQLLGLLEACLAERKVIISVHSCTEMEVLFPFVLYKLDKWFDAKNEMAHLLRVYAKEEIYHPYIMIGDEILPLLKIIFHSMKISKQVREFIVNISRELGIEKHLYQWSDSDERLAKMRNITNREKDILQEMAKGFSNQEIALRLSISENTVKTHVNNIYRKFSVSSRVQAVKMAQAMKII